MAEAKHLSERVHCGQTLHQPSTLDLTFDDRSQSQAKQMADDPWCNARRERERSDLRSRLVLGTLAGRYPHPRRGAGPAGVVLLAEMFPRATVWASTSSTRASSWRGSAARWAPDSRYENQSIFRLPAAAGRDLVVNRHVLPRSPPRSGPGGVGPRDAARRPAA